tara:strand:- start:545 stop:1390 length:846 start_codon:yes stop_codon:yes gene_type:complete
MTSLLDTHQHLLYREKLTYAWTKDIPPLAEGDFSVNDYNSLTKGLDIAGSLFMEVDADDYKKESHFLNTLSKDPANGIKGLIVSIRPENEDGFESWLNESIEMGVIGYRRILHVVPDEMSQSDIFRKNIRKIGYADKTFDICFLSKQLSVAIDLAKACDNTKLILNHCGVPDIAGGDMDPWKKNILELSQLSNVTCKLSGLMAYCPAGKSSLETIQPYVDHVIESFGPNRIVWGSDWPVINLGKGLEEWISVTRQILSKLTNDEAKAIAQGTAKSVYKVEV